jgi:hypothetical protein
MSLCLIEDTQLDNSFILINKLLQNNCQTPLLQALQMQILHNGNNNDLENNYNLEFTLEDGLLLYKGCLVVSKTRLRTKLI